MKKSGNIVIWGLVVLLVIYCGIYSLVNLKHENDAAEPVRLNAEKGDSGQQAVQETADAAQTEGFWDIFARVYSEQDVAVQDIKLFVSGENGYFFLPAYGVLNDITIHFDEDVYDVYVDDEVQKSGAGLDVSGTDLHEMMVQNRDGTQGTYLLHVMRSENLSSIFISTANDTMDYINDAKGNYEPGYLICVDSVGSIECAAALAKIKLHGFTSLSVPKKTYQVDFCEPVDLLDMGSAEHWILQANAYDHSYMRNKLTYDMYENVSSNYAVGSMYADVYFNNEYAGNYLICEKVEAGMNRIELDSAQRYLSDEEKEPAPIVEEDSRRYFDYISEDDTERGYLIEAQNLLKDSDEQRMSGDECFFLSASGRYEVKWPEKVSKTQIEYISGYLQKVEELIYDCDTALKYRELGNYIDIDSFAIMYIMDLITNDVDANDYSTFYYKLSESQGSKLYAGPVWDYDRGFGNEERNVDVNVNGYPNGLCEALYQNAQFQNRVQVLFRERFEPVLDELAALFFEEMPETLRRSVAMDEERWQSNLDRLNYSYDSFAEEAAYVKYYYEERIEIVGKFINKTGEYHMVTFTGPTGRSKNCLVADGELLKDEMLVFMRNELHCDMWTHRNGTAYQMGRPILGDMVLYGAVRQQQE